MQSNWLAAIRPDQDIARDSTTQCHHCIYLCIGDIQWQMQPTSILYTWSQLCCLVEREGRRQVKIPTKRYQTHRPWFLNMETSPNDLLPRVQVPKPLVLSLPRLTSTSGAASRPNRGIETGGLRDFPSMALFFLAPFGRSHQFRRAGDIRDTRRGAPRRVSASRENKKSRPPNLACERKHRGRGKKKKKKAMV